MTSIYVSCGGDEWNAYDLERRHWIRVPNMTRDECFKCSNKESFVAGTDLLVFGRDFTGPVLLRYNILTNSWIQETDTIDSPRCHFGSTSVGQKAYVVGGIDYFGRILSTAWMYDSSEEKVWTPLQRRLNRARGSCSAVFMDGKLYVIGGLGSNGEVLTCGEEYDFERGMWRVINRMSMALLTNAQGAAPRVAVVNNELYAADNEKNVKRYDKQSNRWFILGKLPESVRYINELCFSFKACGDKLINIGSSSRSTHGVGGFVELYSWVPNEQPLTWNLIARHPSGASVYNSAAMSC